MFSLITIWHDRTRYLPGILAVTFSSLLIALQTGLLIGLFRMMAIPIDHARADVWVGYPDVPSVDLSQPIPEDWLTRLAQQPEVVRIETSRQGFASWARRTDAARAGEPAPPAGTPRHVLEGCMVIGTRLDDDALGLVSELRDVPMLRARLADPGTIIVDGEDMQRLGVQAVGDRAEINGRLVRVVGTVRGVKSLGAPFVFCSLETARQLLRQREDQTTYLLAQCADPRDAAAVAARLNRAHDDLSAFTREQFSWNSSVYWLMKTKAGFALGLAALLGLVVGGVVTSQTLYAATATSLPQFKIMLDLGIPLWRIRTMVLAQSFWVGLFGIALALPVIYLVRWLASLLQTPVDLAWWLIGATGVITMGMALLSSLPPLRLLRQHRPVSPVPLEPRLVGAGSSPEI
jgi:putative ABC transport system permease protein